MNLSCMRWAAVFAACGLVFPHATWAVEQAVDLEALGKLALLQKQRLRTNAAAWTRIFESSDGKRLTSTVTQDGTRKRIAVSLDVNGKPVPGFQCIERDGFWYITDELGRRKHRPFEATFSVAHAYEILLDIEVDTLDSPSRLKDARLESIQNNVAVFRLPLSATTRASLEGFVEQSRRAMKYSSAVSNTPLQSMVKKALEHRERLLREEAHITVDVTTGTVLEFEDDRTKYLLKDLRWLDSPPEKDFAVDGQPWEDRTPLVFTPSSEECILTAGRLFLVNDDVDITSEVHLLNLQSSEFRRVPFRGLTGAAGCFLKDRSRILVPGQSTDDLKFRPYEVNLQTGSQRPLGGEAIATEDSGNFVLSNDGKTVAFLHELNNAKRPGKQLCLLDLATDKVRPIGEPMELLLRSWLPGDQGLLGQVQEDSEAAPLGRGPNICLIDLNGKVQLIREGTQPVLLSATQRILYLDSNDRLWHTCEMKGWHARLFHDGLPDQRDATLAPDGKRVLLMKDRPKEPSLCYIYEDEDRAGKVFKLPSGRWTLPVWK